MVLVATASPYGMRPDLQPIDEDVRPDPFGMYDTTKLMAETLAISYHKVYGLDIVSVRPGYVYGPNTWSEGYYLDRVLAGEAIERETGADLPMDVTYVKDLALGIYLALTVRPVRSRIFNITSGALRRRGEVAEIVRRLVPGARISVGPGVPQGTKMRGPSDLTRARTELGYEPRFTLEAGLADWLAHTRASGAVVLPAPAVP
jgi:nucleoside-diphosphate-sugar epimerase